MKALLSLFMLLVVATTPVNIVQSTPQSVNANGMDRPRPLSLPLGRYIKTVTTTVKARPITFKPYEKTERLQPELVAVKIAPKPEPKPKPLQENQGSGQQVTVATKDKDPAPSTEVIVESEMPTATATNTVWDRLAECESGGNWSINTGNGYYGGLQFNLESWKWAGGTGYPHEASREQQIKIAEKLLSIHPAGWGAWPACTRKLGIR